MSSQKLFVVAIDFGTTYSGYAFSNISDKDKIYTYSWNQGIYHSAKTPTSILFSPLKEFDSFGYEADEKYAALSQQKSNKDWFFFKRFKLTLYTNKAGIPSTQLTLALEPESAALHCQSGQDRTGLSPLRQGEKFLIADCGGGTVDVTAHKVRNDKSLKEIHRASGGPWGGIKVDDAFYEYLLEMFGFHIISSLPKSDVIELDSSFETLKSVSTILKPVTEASKATKEEAKELAPQINFRGEKSTSETKPAEESTSGSQNPTPIATPPNTPIFTNQTVPTLPMPGQFPFPAFPFPPFGNMPVFPQQQQQGSSFVPRFPYPPQFIPSMFSQMRMSFIVGNQNMGISSPFQTSGTVSTVALSQTSTSSEKSNVPNTSNSSNTTVIPTWTMFKFLQQQHLLQINAERENNTSVTEPDPCSSLLRQRHTDTARQSNQQDNSYDGQYAELEPEPRQSGFRLSTLFIALLLLGITLLIIRRVYLQRM